MTNQEKVVARFLRGESQKKIIAYTLHNAGKGSKGYPVERFDIVEALEPSDMDRLAETMIARAQDDADGMGPSVHRYVINSLLDGDVISSRVPFRIKGNPDMDLDGEDEAGEEAPSMRGVIQMQMRHNEALARTLVGVVQASGMSTARRLESQETTIQRLLDDRMKQLEIIEEAKTEQMERQLVLESEQAKQRRIDMAMNKAALLGPVIVDHLTGGKMQAKDTPMSLLLKELVGSMTADQFQAIAKMLAPAQQVAFFTLIQKLGIGSDAKKESESNGVS